MFFSTIDYATQQLAGRFSVSAGLDQYRQLKNLLITGNFDLRKDVVSFYPELDIEDLSIQLQFFDAHVIYSNGKGSCSVIQTNGARITSRI